MLLFFLLSQIPTATKVLPYRNPRIKFQSLWSLLRRPPIFTPSENIRKVQQTRDVKYLHRFLPQASVLAKEMNPTQTNMPSQNFRAQQPRHSEKHASEAQRKALFITTKSHKKAQNHRAEQTTQKVLSRMFRMTDKCLLRRPFQRFSETVIIIRRRNPSGSNLMGAPMAAIIIIHLNIQ